MGTPPPSIDLIDIHRAPPGYRPYALARGGVVMNGQTLAMLLWSLEASGRQMGSKATSEHLMKPAGCYGGEGCGSATTWPRVGDTLGPGRSRGGGWP